MLISKEQNYETKFWKDWLEADFLKRLELVEKLPLFDRSLGMKHNKLKKHSFAGLVNTNFEDLESAVYVKIYKKENKRHNKFVQKND
ncbi:hypothetical protein J4442_04620 [Candidatus Woesearchaeota archaeon]|nr:hypothetical protein [Candidatus Woesearchaeota archaeon]